MAVPSQSHLTLLRTICSVKTTPDALVKGALTKTVTCDKTPKGNSICVSQVTQEAKDLELRALAKKALLAGCQHVKLTELEWDISADCQTPFSFSKLMTPVIPPDVDQRVRLDSYGAPMEIILHNRCHKCPPCLKARYWLWRLRAATELLEATRTWFGTITLRPEAHFNMMCVASAELRKRSLKPFDESDKDAQFRARHWAISKELQLWLKRVRKASGASIRYLLVCEAHKSGLPHYHILIHQRGEQPIQKRQLETWPHGFTQWKLTSDVNGSSGYVTKYLLKDARARLRASVRYGRASNEIDLASIQSGLGRS